MIRRHQAKACTPAMPRLPESAARTEEPADPDRWAAMAVSEARRDLTPVDGSLFKEFPLPLGALPIMYHFAMTLWANLRHCGQNEARPFVASAGSRLIDLPPSDDSRRLGDMTVCM